MSLKKLFKKQYCLTFLQLMPIFSFGTAQAFEQPQSPLGRVQIVLEAPFKKLVDEGKADYQNHGKNSKFSVPGLMTFQNQPSAPRQVELSLRGQTSVESMDFPKYKIKFSEKDKSGKSQSVSLKVLSHGWEKDNGAVVGPGGGVLQSRLGVYREASVYDLLRKAGLPVAQVRRASITYKYTDSKKTMTEPAMLIESYKTLGQRIGAEEVSYLEISDEDKQKVSESSWTPLIYLAEVMIGNWDFAIPTPETYDADLHNITIMRQSDGTLTPFMEDFNMANMVSMNPMMDPHIKNDFYPQKSNVFRAKLWAFQSMSEEFDTETIKKSVAYFLRYENDLLQMVPKLDIDEKGRQSIQEHLRAFFEILHNPKYWGNQ